MAKSAKVKLFNQSGQPQVWTDQGHVLDAGGRCEVDEPDATARLAIDAGYLLVEQPEPEAEKAMTGKPRAETSGESAKER